jgi:hypothetical protein
VSADLSALDLRNAPKQLLTILDCLQALFDLQQQFLNRLSERVQVLANTMVQHRFPPI